MKTPAHVLSWKEIDQQVELLCENLQGKAVDVIVGITRSGLIPAVMIAHRLAIRDLVPIEIRRTVSDDVQSSKTEPRFLGDVPVEALAGKRVLLVDDIVGEGRTLLHARERLEGVAQEVISCVLVVNRQNLGAREPGEVVDLHACQVRGWTRFPWESPREG